MPLDRPILVTGAPRSGKSLVSDLLAQSPEVLSVVEPVMLWDSGLRSGSDDRRTAADATDQVRLAIARRCEEMVRRAGKSRYLDNLSYHAVRIPFVRTVLPQARIIHVIRDGVDAIPEMVFGWTFRDSIAQAIARRRKAITLRAMPHLVGRFAVNYISSRLQGRRKTWGPRVPGLAEFVRSHCPAEVAAFQWLGMVGIALDDLQAVPSDQWIEVRYENLIGKPAAEGARIAKFAQVSDMDAVVEYVQNSITPKFKLDRRVEPTEDEWTCVRQMIEPLRRRLGYA